MKWKTMAFGFGQLSLFGKMILFVVVTKVAFLDEQLCLNPLLMALISTFVFVVQSCSCTEALFQYGTVAASSNFCTNISSSTTVSAPSNFCTNSSFCTNISSSTSGWNSNVSTLAAAARLCYSLSLLHTVYCLQCTVSVYSLQCTVYSVQFKVYSLQCTV